MTKRQIEVINLIAPYSMGAGKTYKEAAKELKCTVESIKKVVSNIKRSSPEVYKKLQEIKLLAQKDRELLKSFNVKRLDVSNAKIRNKF